MDKQQVVKFFDRMAPGWDAGTIGNDDVIKTILDYAGVSEGLAVLDVGCGTGVLVPYYLARDVAEITAVDISKKMIECARKKCTDPSVSFVCADAETAQFEKEFDCCVIYNAFPHFPNPPALIKNLSACIKTGGVLTIAHGHSREQINRHHMEHAASVSVELMDDDALSALLAPYFNVVVTVSDGCMQQIVGIKR